jgi:ribonuclease Z
MESVNATLFSKGLYSSWCHLPQLEILFDAGEGAATHLGNELFNVTRIFIGHHHGDHTLGLPSIIGCRNMVHGMSRNPETRDANKPLTVYYPKGSGRESMQNLFGFIWERNRNWLRYELEFIEIEHGMEIEVAKDTFVQAFTMLHDKNYECLGYRVIERRKRLKKEFIGEDIRALKKSGFVGDVMENYSANLFAYCLDAYKIPEASRLSNCECAIMDCTFVNPDDRDDPTHFTLQESIELCAEWNVKKMVVGHLSPRYDSRYVRKAIDRLKGGIDDPTIVWYEGSPYLASW